MNTVFMCSMLIGMFTCWNTGVASSWAIWENNGLTRFVTERTLQYSQRWFWPTGWDDSRPRVQPSYETCFFL